MKLFEGNPRDISDRQAELLKEKLIRLGDLSGIIHNRRTGNIVGGNQRSKIVDINKCKIELTHEFTKPDKQGTVAMGYVIWKRKRYNFRRVDWDVETENEANIAANAVGGTWNHKKLAENFDFEQLITSGMEVEMLKVDLFFPEKKEKKESKPKKVKGSQLIRYELVFQTKNEQEKFYNFLSELKTRYPEIPTITGRIIQHIIENSNAE